MSSGMLILSAIIAPIVVALVATFVAQRLQIRAWREKQRQLGLEDEYKELRSLWNEISARANYRIFSMRYLLYALRDGGDSLIGDRLQEYREQTKLWNSEYSAYCNRLSLFARRNDSITLERVVHNGMFSSGEDLTQLVNQAKSGTDFRARLGGLERDLQALYRETLIYTNDLLRYVKERREAIMVGSRISYSMENLYKFSTRELIQFLFVSDVVSTVKFRPLRDLISPSL